MEFFVFLPQSRLGVEQVVARALAAERLGFSGMAFMDHLVTPMAEGQDLWEAMTLATWVAARTTTLRIGHLVLCDAFRHPAVLAKQVATLDSASGGRFEVGLGWGSWPSELTGFGITEAGPAARAARLADTVRTLSALWAGEPVRQDGPRQVPVPTTRPTLVVGGAGPTALALAREHADWWNLPAPDLHRLAELRGQVGRARVSVQQMVALQQPDDVGGASVARARRHFGHLGAGLVAGTAAELRAHFVDLEGQGVDRVYVWFPDQAPEQTLEAFAHAVLAPLGSTSS